MRHDTPYFGLANSAAVPGIGLACRFAAIVALCLVPLVVPTVAGARKKQKPPAPSRVEVHTGVEDCSVDLDSGSPAKTGQAGVLALESVEPGDHYVHITCPDGRRSSRFISPAPGEKLTLTPEVKSAPDDSGMAIAERQMQLREHIQNAIRLRAGGKIDEAAEHLREARRLDPANSDLHRELGITFLLGKEWKRAQVEMLEAIWNDSNDAQAYNGLGYALEKLGQMDAAIEAFRTASKLEPGEISYRRQYFDALARQQEEKALQQNK